MANFAPAPEILNPEQSLLLMVDAQERLLPAMTDEALLRRNLGMLLKGADLLQVPTMITEQYPKGLGHTAPELLAQAPKAQIFEKTDFSAARAEGVFELILKSGKSQIIVCGMEAHVCVTQTVLDLLANLPEEVSVYLVEDAVSSRTPANKARGVQRMEWTGAMVLSTEAVLFDWMGHSKHPAFKEISALVR
jgi:hypothetical protein